MTPIFKVSCVTGQNLELLKMFLNLVPPGYTKGEQEKLVQESTEFQVIMELYPQQIMKIHCLAGLKLIFTMAIRRSSFGTVNEKML